MTELVIDASVARAAGTGNPHANPPAPQSIDCLEAVRDGSFSVVFDGETRDEWLRHGRPFAVKWLANMKATKRFRFLRDVQWEHLGVLLEAAADLPGNQPAAVAKDAHVVALAMVSDRRVLSGDLRQRELLGKLDGVPDLELLCWASPAEPGTLGWLHSGAPHRDELTPPAHR